MKTQAPTTRPRTAGFSAVELAITVVVLAILMGVVKMRSGSLLNHSKITKITQAVDVIKPACVLFHTDTSKYAQYTDGQASPLLESPLPGWNGPYLQTSGLSASNPFGDFRLSNESTGFGLVSGWDLDSDGQEEITGACNVAVLHGIDDETALKLDTYYDGPQTQAWEKGGRFQHIAASQIGLIFIYR